MADSPLGLQRALPLRPLGVVPDDNVFTRRAWVDRLVSQAESGHIRLHWSPKIIEEVARVRLWIWIKGELRAHPPARGSSAWKRLWVRYSADAHAWFARISPLIRVIEDRPPHEPAWNTPHPDPNDAWLWNAARRIGADVVVTENLKDAPPADAVGSRLHERVAYVHPEAFILLLNVFGGILEDGRLPEDLTEEVRRTARSEQTGYAPVAAAQLEALLARMAEEAELATTEADPAS